MMKKLSIILFALLFVAVATLYVLHFAGEKTKKGMEPVGSTVAESRGIVYVNIDTIIFNFDMFADRRNDLLEKQRKAEAELNSKGSQYESGVKDYQEKVSKGLVTRATAQQMEQTLMQQQQELLSLRDKLQSDLLEEEQVMNRQIIDYITKFLEENKKEYNYQFILGKSFGGPVLYADSVLDITYKVLKALNDKYRAEKK
ncbi:MAG: OmpH family outer membrane protein [Bacteroidales bacterium]|nr:OmpH family outer membrane protein [Bacteroidales bacterium]